MKSVDDDIRAQVPVDFAANLIRFHRLNDQETNNNKLIKIVIQDSDCEIENSNNHGYNFRRFSPCFYSSRFYQAGGKPWYWSNDIKPLKWNELNDYFETHKKDRL